MLKVFDILERDISTLVNEYKSAGVYEISFNGQNLPSGIYYYRFTAGEYTVTKKMMLVK